LFATDTTCIKKLASVCGKLFAGPKQSGSVFAFVSLKHVSCSKKPVKAFATLSAFAFVTLVNAESVACLGAMTMC